MFWQLLRGAFLGEAEIFAMAYNGAQDSDQGWKRPRLKTKKNQRSAEDSAAAKDGVSGAKESGTSIGSSLKAKIKARREQEQVKGVSQGIKARSKALNQKQEEKAAQEEIGGEVVGKKRSANKKKFKNNKLFGLTLLAPGLDECDPEGVAALDGTLAACLGQAPAAARSAFTNESCSARHPAPDEMEPLPMAAPSAPVLSVVAPVEADPVSSAATHVETASASTAAKAHIAAPISPLRPYRKPPQQAASELRPYIPGRRPAASAELPDAESSSISSNKAESAAAPIVASSAKPAAKLQLAIPTSPLRPYRGQPREVASERKPYIPGRRLTSPAGSQPVAPSFGTGTASVYSAPVSAANLGSSPSKNTVLPLPVGRSHKADAKKEEIYHEGEGNYRSSARVNSGTNLKGAAVRVDGSKEDCNQREIAPSEEEDAEVRTEGQSLMELLKSVPVAKQKLRGK